MRGILSKTTGTEIEIMKTALCAFMLLAAAGISWADVVLLRVIPSKIVFPLEEDGRRECHNLQFRRES